MAEPILLAGGSILVDGAFLDADLFVEDGNIARVLPREAAATSGARTVEVGGRRVLPGFIDVHTHGGAGVDFNHASADDARRAASFFASRGVTSFLPTLLADSPETLKRQLDLLSDPALVEACPQIIGVHLEGPFLAPTYRGAQPAEFLRACDLSLFEEFQKAARGRIRLMTISPELEGSAGFTASLCAAGVRVSLGHSAASYEEAMAAIHAGATGATHVMNAMKLLHMHDPAILTAVLESDVYAEMICDGIHLHPPIVRLLLKVKGLDRVIAVTDSIMAAGLPDGRYVLGANEVLVTDGDAKIASTGVRAGSTLTMDKAARNISEFTGLGLDKVSRIVSENPAKYLGIFGWTGSIAEGKAADLVVLDEAGTVVLTVARGEVVYRKI